MNSSTLSYLRQSSKKYTQQDLEHLQQQRSTIEKNITNLTTQATTAQGKIDQLKSKLVENPEISKDALDNYSNGVLINTKLAEKDSLDSVIASQTKKLDSVTIEIKDAENYLARKAQNDDFKEQWEMFTQVQKLYFEALQDLKDAAIEDNIKYLAIPIELSLLDYPETNSIEIGTKYHPEYGNG